MLHIKMIDKNICTIIGECVKLHGVKGEFVIRLKEGIRIEDINAGFLHFELDGGLVPFKIKTIREKNATDILVSLYDTDSENRMKRLLASMVYVENADLDTDSDYRDDPASYVGWKVKDITEGDLGEITDVIKISGNPLFVINDRGAELLIPANEDLIDEVDEKNKTIVFVLPEGLLSAND